MPFLATYFITDDPAINNENAVRLADYFRQLSGATRGELVLHADPKSVPPEEREALNGFIIEYQSNDPNRSTESLGETVSRLIDTFMEGSLYNPVVKALDDFEQETIAALGNEIKLAL